MHLKDHFGIQVARLAGLPDEVVQRAKQILSNLEDKRNPKKGPSHSMTKPPNSSKKLNETNDAVQIQKNRKAKQARQTSDLSQLELLIVEESLYFEEGGDSANPPIVFLHGLLGSSRNWRSVCKDLENDFHTIAFDLPNHGQSFHQTESSVASMSESVIKNWQIGLDNFFVCGHSLGGKVAMKMACDYSHRIKKLLVVILLRDYPADHHLPTLKALADLDLIGLIKERRWMKPLQKNSKLGFPAVSYEFRGVWTVALNGFQTLMV